MDEFSLKYNPEDPEVKTSVSGGHCRYSSICLSQQISFIPGINNFYSQIDLFNIFKTASLSLSYCSTLPSKNDRSLDINV